MKKKTFKITVPNTKTGKKGTITLEGELNISNVELIKDKVLPYLTFEKLFVKLRNVSSFDLSVIQMLVAFKENQEKNHKEFDIDVHLSGEVKELYLRAGLNKAIDIK